jgi:hypothetical protein
MLTLDELRHVLINNYTAEELVDILRLTSSDIIEGFDDVVEDKFDYLIRVVKEDLGYASDES